MKLQLLPFLKGKVFRLEENTNKIEFVTRNSSITMPLIVRAATISGPNPFHNFGHQIGVTEYAIRIAIAENRPINEIDSVAVGSTVHDAKHNGVMNPFDEVNSFEAAKQFMDPEDFKLIHENFERSIAILRDLIMATVFSNRGKINDDLAKIIQDADVAHVGQGIVYWLWASMGLIEEFNRQRKVPVSPFVFIRVEQEQFINHLANCSPSGTVYLSKGANRIFRNPLQDVQIIKNLPEAAIMFAYNNRHKDINLRDFEKEITPLMSA